jgi:hypothetical protein
LTHKKGAVFVFLAADCPLSQNYTLTLNRLQAQFQPKGVSFYGVFSGHSSEKKAVDEFVKTYKSNFQVVPDPDFTLADFFGATKTPEAFAVDPKASTFYKGAIDNWAPQLGQHRTVVTEHYLLDALNSLLEGSAVQIRQTEAIGCSIERGRFDVQD